MISWTSSLVYYERALNLTITISIPLHCLWCKNYINTGISMCLKANFRFWKKTILKESSVVSWSEQVCTRYFPDPGICLELSFWAGICLTVSSLTLIVNIGSHSPPRKARLQQIFNIFLLTCLSFVWAWGCPPAPPAPLPCYPIPDSAHRTYSFPGCWCRLVYSLWSKSLSPSIWNITVVVSSEPLTSSHPG